MKEKGGGGGGGGGAGEEGFALGIRLKSFIDG